MRVRNIHNRKIQQPKEKISELIKTLASNDDLIWPNENWPAIRFKEELKVGSHGGHGFVRYTVIEYKQGESIKFKFTKPKGFYGTHEFKINALDNGTTEIFHEIRMQTSIKAYFLWLLIIKWLHDALIEDAFDKVENHFTQEKKTTTYNIWVKLLREFYGLNFFKAKNV